MRRIPSVISLIIFLLSSCQFSEDGIKTLDSAINQKWLDNLRIIDQTAKEVEESGNRGADVEILNDSKTILKLRSEFNVPENPDSIDNKLNVEFALKYVDKLGEFTREREIALDQDIIESIRRLSKENLNEQLKKRLIFLNILNLESQIFEDRAIHIGSNCGFCYSFNFFREQDSIRLGETHESIVSIADRTNEFQDFSFENINVSIDGKDVETDYVSIGSSVYMKFPVKQTGKYLYTGDLRIKYEGVENEYLCRFRFEVYGLKD